MERSWYKASWVVPVSQPPLRDGIVEVVGERITRVISPGVDPGEAPARVVDLGQAALLPGLVDLSSRLELAALRGVFPASRHALWIEDLTRARYKVLQPGDYLTSALWGAIEGARGGVTTHGDVGTTQAGAMALCQLGLQGTYYLEVFGPHPRQATEALEKAVRELIDLAEILPSRIRIGLSPMTVFTVSPALFKDMARLARRHELDLCMHVAETREERDFVHSNTGPLADLHRSRMNPHVARGMSPVMHLDSLGMLEGGPLLVHAVHLDDADRERLRERGARIVHCPRANTAVGAGVASIAGLRAAGVPVGLGSSAALPHAISDVLEEARAALSLAGDALPVDDALRMATLEGARILGLDRLVGSLEAGKQADLVGVALPADAGEDPVGALLRAGSRRDVVLTVAAGHVLHRTGERTELDDIEDTLRPMFLDLCARLGNLAGTLPVPEA